MKPKLNDLDLRSGRNRSLKMLKNLQSNLGEMMKFSIPKL